MKSRGNTLAATWDFSEAASPVGSTALRRVQHAIKMATLPATIAAIERPCGLSRERIKATLAALEAAGEVDLNRRGDVVFAIHHQPEQQEVHPCN